MSERPNSHPSLVKELRKIRDQINEEIQDLTVEELKVYWKGKKSLQAEIV